MAFGKSLEVTCDEEPDGGQTQKAERLMRPVFAVSNCLTAQ
jgi:hypothetical protein